MSRLEGKVALVTGGASGIGKACCERMAEEGAFVYVTDINEKDGKAVAESLGSLGAFLPLDVREEDQWAGVIEAIVKAKGRLDTLVNNAGIIGFDDNSGPQDPEEASLESWREVHRVNLDGVFLGCKYAIRAMKGAKSGSIINMSSRSGLVGIPTAAAYASSKAAVRNHTKSVALYCAEQGYNIRCNSIHPAAVLTPLWDPMLGEGEAREKAIENLAQGAPLQRVGMPDDVAWAVVYFAADESAYITGTELTIDGGILAGSHRGLSKISEEGVSSAGDV